MKIWIQLINLPWMTSWGHVLSRNDDCVDQWDVLHLDSVQLRARPILAVHGIVLALQLITSIEEFLIFSFIAKLTGCNYLQLLKFIFWQHLIFFVVNFIQVFDGLGSCSVLVLVIGTMWCVSACVSVCRQSCLRLELSQSVHPYLWSSDQRHLHVP